MSEKLHVIIERANDLDAIEELINQYHPQYYLDDLKVNIYTDPRGNFPKIKKQYTAILKHKTVE